MAPLSSEELSLPGQAMVGECCEEQETAAATGAATDHGAADDAACDDPADGAAAEDACKDDAACTDSASRAAAEAACGESPFGALPTLLGRRHLPAFPSLDKPFKQIDKLQGKLQRSLVKNKGVTVADLQDRLQRTLVKKTGKLLGLGKVAALRWSPQLEVETDPGEVVFATGPEDEALLHAFEDRPPSPSVDNLPLALQDEFSSLGLGAEVVEQLYASIKSQVDDDFQPQMVTYIAGVGLGVATLQQFWDECVNNGCDAAGRANPFEARSTTPVQELWKAAFSLTWHAAYSLLDSSRCCEGPGALLHFERQEGFAKGRVVEAFHTLSVEACKAGA